MREGTLRRGKKRSRSAGAAAIAAASAATAAGEASSRSARWRVVRRGREPQSVARRGRWRGGNARQWIRCSAVHACQEVGRGCMVCAWSMHGRCTPRHMHMHMHMHMHVHVHMHMHLHVHMHRARLQRW